jgi:hypothetical protein
MNAALFITILDEEKKVPVDPKDEAVEAEDKESSEK